MDPNRDFAFPYPPYDIQLKLMNVIYDSIDSGKISIVESPTGTGKSLSIICSILKWKSDFKQKELNGLTKKIENLKLSLKTNGNDSMDWIEEQLKQISSKNEINDLNGKLEQFAKHEEYCKTVKRNVSRCKHVNREQIVSNKRQTDLCDIDCDDDYDLIVQFDENDPLIEDAKDGNFYRPKVYYCSRTHSQLAQFISEIKKTKYAKAVESIMMVPLGSRVNYCINPAVNRHTNSNIVNEKCNELQNSKKKCPLYKHSLMPQLRDEILANIQDIEEIVTKGKKISTCPYFTSRQSIAEAEIVVLPYQILLHKGTRESFGLDLKDSIVIIDEAHNLLETISSVYSVEISASQIASLQKYVTLYISKYYSRFNPLNLMYLKQLMFILKRLLNFIQTTDPKQQSWNPLDFLLKLEIENLNIYKLIQFIDQSRIASKLHMFSLKPPESVETKKSKISGTLEFLSRYSKKEPAVKTPSESVDAKPELESLNTNTIHSVKEFLLSLKSYDLDGKVLLNKNSNEPDQSCLKYVLLNPSSHFKDILSDCRSVILCGGTMKPFDDYINQLFKPLNIPAERILTFSCDHVITTDKLIALGCARGASSRILNYTFSERNKPTVVQETGETIAKLCSVIPKGVVVFFPSYDYEEFVLNQWGKSGILRSIERAGKRIYKEPKKSSLVAAVLNSYTKFINATKDNGAILFSVIGGKMSEGINFSDDLGRGVIVIGLPYANKNSADLKEKMSYLDSQGDNLGNEYYENLCMRAVNQSIGRAIRHREDYSAIVLLDQRYHSKPTIRSKLSNWIQTRYESYDQFNPVYEQIKRFFELKKC